MRTTGTVILRALSFLSFTAAADAAVTSTFFTWPSTIRGSSEEAETSVFSPSSFLRTTAVAGSEPASPFAGFITMLLLVVSGILC